MIGRVFSGDAGRWPRRAGTAAAAALLVGAPIVGADGTAPGTAPRGDRALDAAAAWADSLSGVRAPAVPAPRDTESLIVVLAGGGSAAAPAGERAAMAREISRAQERLEPVLAGLGARVAFRYRVLMNAMAVELPAGRASQIAALPEVLAIHPVTLLAPASLDPQPLPPAELTPTAAVPAPLPATDGAAVLALIDGGIDPTHPALGGGIGPSRPVLGGRDFVDGDADPTMGTGPVHLEAHGTAMAGIVVGSPALAGLAPAAAPRLLVHRVVALERADGRVQPLARSDRVIAALEHAVDPDGDGDPSDRADVVLLGVARGFAGAGDDPLADAVWRAEATGSVIVAPAGNDGPTLAPTGTIGGPAASPAVLAVGGLATHSPREVTLEVGIGPAHAGLVGLPLLGGAGTEDEMPVVFVTASDGRLRSGDAPADFARAEGALAVVARSGAPLRDKAANAAAAGAAALAVWDTSGSGAFPGVDGGAEWPLPVVGLGARQGQALADLLTVRKGATVRMNERRPAPNGVRPASFSSRGAAPAGRAKPDISAPAVAVPAPYPGGGTTLMTGTSAAAAQVAAAALRLRVDQPAATPLHVRSALIQGADRVGDAVLADVGAGALAAAADPIAVIDPPIVSAGVKGRATIALEARAETPVQVRLVHVAGDGLRTALGRPLVLRPGVRAGRRLRVPADPTGRGRIEVVEAGDERTLAVAPVVRRAAVRTPTAALGIPEITAGGGLASVAIQVGRLERRDGHLDAVRLHDVRVELLPEIGGEPLAVTGDKHPGEWVAGRYRLLLAQRLANGRPRPAGRYRVRVSARGPDGRRLVRVSAPAELS